MHLVWAGCGAEAVCSPVCAKRMHCVAAVACAVM